MLGEIPLNGVCTVPVPNADPLNDICWPAFNPVVEATVTAFSRPAIEVPALTV